MSDFMVMGPLPPIFQPRNQFFRDPRRRYRRDLWSVRARRHAYRDAIYQAKRKARKAR